MAAIDRGIYDVAAIYRGIYDVAAIDRGIYDVAAIDRSIYDVAENKRGMMWLLLCQDPNDRIATINICINIEFSSFNSVIKPYILT